MIDIDSVLIKYITGSYRYSETYPEKTDLLWDIVDTGKKTLSIDLIDWIDSEKRDKLLSELLSEGFIKINSNRITVLKTYWDGRSNE